MQIVKEFSVSLVNKPGVLAGVLKALSKAKVNGVAMTLADSGDRGVLRLVVDQPLAAEKVLSKLNVPVTATDVLLIELDNSPGAMADVAGKLAQEHINICYAYCTSGARGGRTTGIINVENLAKAMKILAPDNVPKNRSPIRRSQANRKP